METIKIYGMNELSTEFKEYNKTMKRAGIDSFLFDTINQFLKSGGKLEVTSNRYEKQGRKNFPKNPTTTEKEVISARNYACYMSSIGFFGDKVYKSYTYCGYIPTRIVCKNPDNTVKVERIFKFEK